MYVNLLVTMGKIGQLTKNYGLLRREKKKRKISNILGIISPSLVPAIVK